MKYRTIVYVEWRDSGATSAWTAFDRMESDQVCVIRTAGWLVTSTDSQVTVVQSLDDENEHGMGIVSIPRESITVLRELFREFE